MDTTSASRPAASVPGHRSVLLAEAVRELAVHPADVVVDATLGGAGHFSLLLALLSRDGTLIGIDADPEAVERARAVVALDRRADRPVVHLITDNFRNLARILDRLDIARANRILFDLGWSGYQLSANRGFSFQSDGPLLMTYGTPEEGKTAADIVNTWSERDLADLIHRYGEEPHARAIAGAIVLRRREKRIISTGDLAGIVSAAVPAWYRTRRAHPATKTFQALRIAANDELGALTDGLAQSLAHLAPGGRLAVITFHSIEDRIVKETLRAAALSGAGTLVHKKPLAPGRREILANPRARSAKLRVFERAVEDAACGVPPLAASRAYA